MQINHSRVYTSNQSHISSQHFSWPTSSQGLFQVITDHPYSPEPARIIQMANPRMFTLPCCSWTNPNKGYGLDFSFTPASASWPKLGVLHVALWGVACPSSLEILVISSFSGLDLSILLFSHLHKLKSQGYKWGSDVPSVFAVCKLGILALSAYGSRGWLAHLLSYTLQMITQTSNWISVWAV